MEIALRLVEHSTVDGIVRSVIASIRRARRQVREKVSTDT